MDALVMDNYRLKKKEFVRFRFFYDFSLFQLYYRAKDVTCDCLPSKYVICM